MREWSQEKGVRLWAVHRLDEEVSGILLFAKTSEAHRSANEWFEKRLAHKHYEALTESVRSPLRPHQKVVWRSRLLRGKKRAYEREFGKEALTEAVLEGEISWNSQTWSCWKLSPLTGRAHQLRFELSKQGCPIWGDSLYGSKISFPIPETIALRAVSLNLQLCAEREQFGLPVEFKALGLVEWMKENIPS